MGTASSRHVTASAIHKSPGGQLSIVSDAGTKIVGLSGTGLDSTPPTLQNLPANMTVEATGPAGAMVSYTGPTATDDVDPSPTVVCAPASGGTFPFGTTTVACTAKDASGNTSTASFTVTVRDTTAPVISGVPSSSTVPATSPSGAVVTFTLPTATDVVSGAVTPVCVPASGSTFAIGTVPVTCKATDGHGNSATATFTVTVTGAVVQIQALQAVVNGLPELRHDKLQSQLDSELQDALKSLGGKKPSTAAACRDLQSFISDASNSRNVAPRGPLTPADSASLVAEATQIGKVLGC